MILEEYIDVLSRDKFARYSDFKINSDIIIATIEHIAEKYNPNIKINNLKDASDSKFLELAIYAKADFLITGNISHYVYGKVHKVKIISPKDYIQNYFKKIKFIASYQKR